MKKIKIIQVGFSYRHGGIETFALSYDSYLNNESFQVDYINIFPKANDIKLFREISGKRDVFVLPDYRKKPISYIVEFYKLQKKNNYQICHYNMNSASFIIPLIAAKIARIPIRIAHAHNSSSDKGMIKEFVHNINKHLIPLFANVFFSCSDLASKWFYSSKIIQGKNHYQVNNAIELTKFSFHENIRKQIRNQHGANDQTTIIGNVGRFEPQKNQGFLIKVFEVYIKDHPNSLLLLIGMGTMLEELKTYVSAKDELKDKVLFLGQINNVCDYFNAMDIFILPSLYEGLPYVGIEAQANGLPCIFSSAITFELKQSDKVLFEELSADLSDWKADIEELLKSKDLRKTQCIKEYDIEYSAEQLKKIYVTLIEQSEVITNG